MKIEAAESETPKGKPHPWLLQAADREGSELVQVAVVGPSNKVHGSVFLEPEVLVAFAEKIVKEYGK